jgi:hypothetical protein
LQRLLYLAGVTSGGPTIISAGFPDNEQTSNVTNVRLYIASLEALQAIRRLADANDFAGEPSWDLLQSIFEE